MVMTEYLDILDDSGNVIGQASQEEVYDRKLNHRIVHVLVLQPETDALYLQKRSETKSFLPGYYCTSAGGHVHAGETYQEAAARELEEELGLITPIHEAHAFVFESDGHKRFIKLFMAAASQGIKFLDGEVASGSFHNLEAARQLIEGNEKIHPQLIACFQWFYDNKEKALSLLKA